MSSSLGSVQLSFERDLGWLVHGARVCFTKGERAQRESVSSLCHANAVFDKSVYPVQSWLTSKVGSRIYSRSERERARESLLGRISHLLEALRSLSSAERGHSLPVAVSGGVGGGGGGRGGGNISILR